MCKQFPKKVFRKIINIPVIITILFSFACNLDNPGEEVNGELKMEQPQTRLINNSTVPTGFYMGPFLCFWDMADHNWTNFDSFENSDIVNGE